MTEAPDRVALLFAAAVALPGPEQADFLDRECAGDEALRGRVEALLRAHKGAGHLPDRPGPSDLEQTVPYLAGEQPGTVIGGRYKLLEAIGEGGMGTVWVAEQMQPVRRKVALKLIKAGMDSRSVLARFEAERQALALMDHPNIAKVFDGGLTDTGRPFFVMEYVKGVRMTAYCDATRLSIAQRLQLFVQVCQAVQHAHQKGIIHRDLKPSNILVAPYDDKPVPKVIDFGLAKAMHQPLTERTLHTAHESALGTPLYMSPEQAQLNNLDVDTRSDIYSLGVLLYELLTGTTPLEKQRFQKAAWDEIRRIIREEEPPRPSARLSSTSTLPSLAAGRQTDPARLKKLVRGELDWIVMKALEKDRARRYETANGFAQDIQRYLAGEPVLAVPPSATYRLRKFARKHRVALATATAITLLLVAGVVAVVAVQLRANRELAVKNAELAQEQAKVEKRFELAQKAIAKLHSGVSEDLLLKSDQFKDLRNQLLKEAANFYGEMEKLLEGQTDAKSRRLLAEGYYELAELTEKIGSQSEALALHRKALAVRRELAAVAGADVETRLDVARSLGAVGYLLLWSDMAEALQAIGEQNEMAEALASEAPTEAVQAVLAQNLRHTGEALYNVGKMAEALTATERAAAILRNLSKANPANTEFQYDLARSLTLSGILLWEMGQVPESLAANESGCARLERLGEEHPLVAKFQYRLAQGREDLAEFYLDNGQLVRVLEAIDKVRAISRKLTETHPAVSEFQALLACSYSVLGRALAEMGKPAEAMAALERAQGIEKKVDDENPTIWSHLNLAITYNRIGELLIQTGKKPSAALPFHEQARALLQEPAQSQTAFLLVRSELAFSLERIGLLQAASGKAELGLDACRHALEIRQKQMKAQPALTWLRSELASSHLAMAIVQRRAGQPATAVESLQRAIGVLEQLPTLSPRNHYTLARCHALMAEAASDQGSGLTTQVGKAESEKAMIALQQALAAGFDGIGRLNSDAALDTLRPRAEFQKLVKDLDAKVSKMLETAPLPATK